MPNPKTVLKSFVHRTASAAGLYLQPGGGRSPIPNLADLARRSAWRAPRPMTGVEGAHLETQLAFIDELLSPDIRATLASRDIYAEAGRASGDLGGFCPTDAALLYAVVRARRPARIVQYGTWVSTAAIMIAAADAGYAPQLTILDPSPRPYLAGLQKSGRISLIAERPQEASLDVYAGLSDGDMLFIDSNHAVKVDGEANRLVLDVLPQLVRGVLVHFHGVNFPYDYGRRLLAGDYAFATEGTLLHAFLVGNASFRIAACMSMLHYGARDALKARFPGYAPEADIDGLAGAGGGEFPNSLWLQRVR